MDNQQGRSCAITPHKPCRLFNSAPKVPTCAPAPCPRRGTAWTGNHGVGTSRVRSGGVDASAVASGAMRFGRGFRSLRTSEDASGIFEAGPVSNLAWAGGLACPWAQHTVPPSISRCDKAPPPFPSPISREFGSVQDHWITSLRGKGSYELNYIKFVYPWQDVCS